MPHSTSSGSAAQPPSVNRVKSIGENGTPERELDRTSPLMNGPGVGARTKSPRTGSRSKDANLQTTWLPKRENGYINGSARQGSSSSYGHGRQKSLSDAIRTIRTRRGSISQNAHEIADALRAPVSPRLIGLCIIWWTSSLLTNTSSKSILNSWKMPATLTLIQFAFVASYCLLFSWLASIFPSLKVAIPALQHPIRRPSREVILTTLPLAFFQIGGHLLSSTATSKIPVSLVHTIKGLSPLFTVLAYRLLFNIPYPASTYISLVPLTLGVFMACSGNITFDGQFLGVIYALLAAIIFVTQNIYSKQLFNQRAKAEAEGFGTQSRKLDKLNLLCYSSGLAFILTTPIWLWSEGIDITKDVLHDGAVDLTSKPNSFDHGRLALEFVFNGTFHFAQNILAFILLSLVSPVTYSVASLIKRVYIIVASLVWFRNPTTSIQGFGIALTFLGLYLYDRSNAGNKADRKARNLTEPTVAEPLLPLNVPGHASAGLRVPAFGHPVVASPVVLHANGHIIANGNDVKKTDEMRAGRPRGSSQTVWLPPGTKQEDTWRVGDNSAGIEVSS